MTACSCWSRGLKSFMVARLSFICCRSDMPESVTVTLIGSYTNIKTLFKELSWALDDFHPDVITVYYGEDVTEEDALSASETIIGNFPEADVDVVNGGQPVYYYMISAE